MNSKLGWMTRFVAAFAMALAFTSGSVAQTTTSVETRNFEVISIDGNRLVFRDGRGTNEVTVPTDFRFTVDGKQLAVSDLKPGMKGTATVTTTMTVTPVFVTDLRKGVVTNVTPNSVTVKDDADGVRKRFTTAQLNERGIKLFKGGQAIAVHDVKPGDEVSATIVTQGPPEVVTEQEVSATLAQATPAASAAPAAPAASAAPSAAPAKGEAPPVAAASDASSAANGSSGLGTIGWLLIILVVAALLFFFARRRKA